MSLEERLAALRAEITEASPDEARTLQAGGAVLIDVREPEEVAQGTPESAQALSRGYLELRVGDIVSKRDATVLLLCGSGSRSLLAADDLRRMGYTDVRSVAGGFNRWKDEGLPFTLPTSLSADERARYARQMVLPEVGEAGQAKFAAARVLLIGAGGLGSPAALYLAAAGIGTLGIVDHDRVDRSNLHRQIVHSDPRVGQAKTDSARAAIEGLNPTVTVQLHPIRLSSANVEAIFAGYDIVVDGSDNFPTRYLVNDACVKLGLANVYGAVERFNGQVCVFGAGGRPCYRCLFPQPPPPDQAPPCSEAGVLGVVPGLIGMLQALEVLKLILGFGETLQGKLLLVDARASQFRHLTLSADPDCAYCAPHRPFPGFVDYEGFCNAATTDA
ncbi:MAG: molybdopterin-synthase adenylyltransferase MoeB [Salinisphaera sp.]|nr:molybdopterin-synthase adenylyltransferase MoeB [Salinisphaera sp.]